MKKNIKIGSVCLVFLLLVFGIYFLFSRYYVLDIYPNYVKYFFSTYNNTYNWLSFEEMESLYNVYEVDLNEILEKNWSWVPENISFENNFDKDFVNQIYEQYYSDVNFVKFKSNLYEYLYDYNKNNPENKVVIWGIIKFKDQFGYIIKLDYWKDFDSRLVLNLGNIEESFLGNRYIDAFYTTFVWMWNNNKNRWCLWIQEKFQSESIWTPNNNLNCQIFEKKWFKDTLFQGDIYYYIIAEERDREDTNWYTWINLNFSVYVNNT